MARNTVPTVVEITRPFIDSFVGVGAPVTFARVFTTGDLTRNKGFSAVEGGDLGCRHSQRFYRPLTRSLRRKGLRPFIDDEELPRGEVISEKLDKAIEDSLSAIVILSENYATSPWCLNELQKILESRNGLGQLVLPVFYGVDPSDVRHQKGRFGEAFAKLEDRFREDQRKVQKWRDSLIEVANLAGWNSEDWHETKLIEDVVEALSRKLDSNLPSLNYDTLVGMDSKLDAFHSLEYRIR
ncbi:toll/interleukin-1 receptor-like protein [Prosopis cineraria]|uniref:toll/interleukin-1 receptor-like protein n=1 Tax=Prosopis cineraria TaxID=364024 RepID=UPI00240FF89E|nr:toll/interleukin-1 receptor-like protein [Prosopis cineraria]